MNDASLPVYAIAELLIRMAPLQHNLGEYTGHVQQFDYVIVTTTTGTLILTNELVTKQANFPEAVDSEDLVGSVFTFRTF